MPVPKRFCDALPLLTAERIFATLRHGQLYGSNSKNWTLLMLESLRL